MPATRIFNVLFLCTGNSARSIMAESILNLQGLGRFQAYSAGSHPTGLVQPAVLDMLQRNHYPVEGLRSKDWAEFALPGSPQMDFVLTVCDKARAETCPVWPGQPISAHWGVTDPVAVEGTEEQRQQAYSDAFMTLRTRISLFVNLPFDKLSRLALQTELESIGQTR